MGSVLSVADTALVLEQLKILQLFWEWWVFSLGKSSIVECFCSWHFWCTLHQNNISWIKYYVGSACCSARHWLIMTSYISVWEGDGGYLKLFLVSSLCLCGSCQCQTRTFSKQSWMVILMMWWIQKCCVIWLKCRVNAQSHCAYVCVSSMCACGQFLLQYHHCEDILASTSSNLKGQRVNT